MKRKENALAVIAILLLLLFVFGPGLGFGYMGRTMFFGPVFMILLIVSIVWLVLSLIQNK